MILHVSSKNDAEKVAPHILSIHISPCPTSFRPLPFASSFWSLGDWCRTVLVDNSASLLPHSSLRGFDRCIDNQVAAPVFIFTIWIPYKRFGVDGQIITNRPVFVHFLMLTLSPSLSLSYLHIELIQFNFEAAVPHTWADVLLDRSGTWIFQDFSDSSPVTPAAHEAFVASRESFGHVWTLSSAQTAPTKWRPIVKQNIGKHWDKMYDWKQSKLIYSIYKCI